MKNILEVFSSNLIHLVNDRSLRFLSSRDLVDMVSQEELDSVHLLVEVAAFHIACRVIFGNSSEGANCRTTRGGGTGLAISRHFAYIAIAVNADVRRKHDGNIAVDGNMRAERVPARLAGEGKAADSAERENLTPAIRKHGRDVLRRVVMVNLVRAGAFCKQRVFGSEAGGTQLFEAELLDLASVHVVLEVSLQSVFGRH